MSSMLTVENLSFEYEKQTPILHDISFSVKKGSVCGLFGPNGCGKTTLFKCCLKFLTYSKGKILINDQDIKTTSIHDMAKHSAYVPQEHKPSFSYLVRDVVLMGRTSHFSNGFQIPNLDKQKTLDALHLVGIDHLAYTPYNQLSGGQRQLVIIARAVAQETQLMFLDEPTSALDFSNQIWVWRLLQKIASKGTTIIACTHDPNHVMWFCDSVVVMNNHSLVTVGPPKKVLTEKILDHIYPGTCRVDRFDTTNMVYPRNLTQEKEGSQ